MSQQSNQDNLQAFILAVAVLAVIGYEYNLQSKIDNFISTTLNYFSNLKIIFILVFSFIILIFLVYGLKSFISRKINNAKYAKESLREKEKFIINILDKKLDQLNIEELKKLISIIKQSIIFSEENSKINHYTEELKVKLKEVNIDYLSAKDKERLDKRDKEKYKLDREIEELEKQRYRLQLNKEYEERYILKDLDIDNNDVFLKEKLSKQKIALLLKNGYKQTNQYSIIEKKNVTALVKKVLNHSLTHTFLVWDAVRLLKRTNGAYSIEVHETKDADITFKFNRKLFALEIETGTLLEKKAQLKDKIEYLNKKYPKRWMFIVSNKDLIWRYRKFGFSTQRNEVEKNLQILLKMG